MAFLAVGAGASNRTGPHWGDGNKPREWATFVDYTGSQWPIQAATTEWDFAGRIDVIYRFGSCGGFGHCVGVKTSNSGIFDGVQCGEIRGAAVRQQIANSPPNHIDPQGTRVRFNRHCNNNSVTNGNRRSIACHEEGHILGLDHANDGLATCMRTDHWRQRPNTPRQHDFVMLDDHIYNHSH